MAAHRVTGQDHLIEAQINVATPTTGLSSSIPCPRIPQQTPDTLPGFNNWALPQALTGRSGEAASCVSKHAGGLASELGFELRFSDQPALWSQRSKEADGSWDQGHRWHESPGFTERPLQLRSSQGSGPRRLVCVAIRSAGIVSCTVKHK